MTLDKKDLIAKVKTAQEVAETAQEPYKLETFKTVLIALLGEPGETQQVETGHKRMPVVQPSNSKLADLCGITVEQLANVFDIEDGVISFIAPLEGSLPDKLTNATLCILAAYETVLGKDWVESITLAERLQSAGVGSLDNLARSLKNHPDLFRSKGAKSHTLYKLTDLAKKKALSVIQQLATGNKTNTNVT
jgi:hypothetical protein